MHETINKDLTPKAVQAMVAHDLTRVLTEIPYNFGEGLMQLERALMDSAVTSVPSEDHLIVVLTLAFQRTRTIQQWLDRARYRSARSLSKETAFNLLPASALQENRAFVPIFCFACTVAQSLWRETNSGM